MHAYESDFREPLINGLDKNYTKITDDIVGPTERTYKGWWPLMIIFGALAGFLYSVLDGQFTTVLELGD
jgi:hypothetical protein